MNSIHPVLASFDSFENDLREEAFSFHLPIPSSWLSFIFNIQGDDLLKSSPSLLRIGLVPLSLQFWVQTFALLCLQSLINIAVAVVVYYTIVKPQRATKRLQNMSKTSSREKMDSLTPYIIGYGVICPLLLAWPFFLFQNVLEMHNIALMLCLTGAVPNLLLLRVTEAIHGLLPDFCYQTPGQLESAPHRAPLTMLILYYSATLQFRFDPKTQQPIRLTRAIFWRKVCIFVSVFLQTSLLYSILLPFDYQVFPEPILDDSASVISFSSLWSFFHPFKLANGLLMASLLSLVLDGTSTAVSDGTR
jgi:hypothetical protein